MDCVASADLNRDGSLDQRDIEAWMSGAVPPHQVEPDAPSASE
jgi:hypothetical protein